MADLPRGTVTFLLTDVEGSTRRWERDRAGMSAAIARLDDLVARAVEEQDGQLVKPRGEGDSHFCVFSRVADAVSAAVDIQRVLAVEDGLPLRAAIHTGEAEVRDRDYYGPTVNRAARLRAIGYGGQVLLSAAATDLVRESLPPGLSIRDLGEHQLKDLTAPERVAQVLGEGLRDDFPPLKSLDTDRHNLPVQLTNLIGREEDAANVVAALTGSRLVTLTGAGGSGKTRLALQVAADLVDRFADGVWFVDLSTITDPEVVPTRVAEGIGMPPPAADRSVRDQVLDYVRGKQLLVVLDNCEHLIAECAEMATALLKSGTALHVLATSREALGIGGEAIWLVPSLELPEVDEPAATVAQRAAARLFVERARLKRPGYEIGTADAGFVTQICRRLDGIPLAVELAAGKMGLLSPEQIATRLDDRFRLLVGAGRGAVARQQTLQATVEWSYSLLAPTEQALLRRLSVFVGGFDLEAAEGVCADGADAVLEDLEQLVAKSLVVVDNAVSPPRYRLLETVRQFAAARLLDAEETSAFRDRHLEWFARRGIDLRERTLSPDQARALEDTDRDIDNFRAAMAWNSPRTAATRISLCAAMTWYLTFRGLFQEAYETVSAAVRDGGDATDADALVEAYAMLALVSEGTRAFGEASEWADRALALDDAVSGPARVWIAYALGVDANAKTVTRTISPTEGLESARRAVTVAEGAAPGTYHAQTSLHRLALLTFVVGDSERGLDLLVESADYARRLGVPSAIARANYILSVNAWARDDEVAAEELCDAAEAAQRELGLLPALVQTMIMRAAHADRAGDHARADAIRAEAEAIAVRLDARGLDANTLNRNGYMLLWSGRYADADASFERAIDRTTSELAKANGTHSRGEGRLLAGDLDAAEAWLTESCNLYGQTGVDRDDPTHDLGNVARLRGQFARAATLYAECLRRRRDDGAAAPLSQSLTDICALALAAGEVAVAGRLGGVMARRGRARVHIHLADHARSVWSLARAADGAAFDVGGAMSDEEAIDLALAFCDSLAARDSTVASVDQPEA